MLPETGATPLDGAELDYLSWLRVYAPHAASRPLAPFHSRAWEWAEALRPGVKPLALVECWFRGGGKSTTVELITTRQAVLARRRFVLYVSDTQDAANRHVQSIAGTMERVGVARAVNQYGFSLGWKADMLRTDNGFNVLALGLDAAVRGVKFDQFRPDFIILDDVDALGDSLETVAKKRDIITQSILPAGSSDAAVAFFQNAIHQHSLMSGTLNGSLDMLRRRVRSHPVPAVENLRWEQIEMGDGGREYRITGGTATWDGKSIAACEADMNEFTLVSFLRECQHDVTMGGRFFADWDEKRHLLWRDELSIEKRWTFWGGYDWGYGNPACFLLACIDEKGAVLLIDEVYHAQKTDEEQAQAVTDCLTKWSLKRADVTILADPSMWAMKTDHSGKKVANVTAFLRAGLRFVKANNNRRFGWANVRRYLKDRVPGDSDTVPVPFLRVVRNDCPHLARTLPQMVHDPTDVEDLDTHGDDHACDTLRYLLNARPRPTKEAPPPTVEPDHRPAWLRTRTKDETL